MALLEVEHLSHEFIEKVLYKDSSFELYKGEHMGIVRTKRNREKYVNKATIKRNSARQRNHKMAKRSHNRKLRPIRNSRRRQRNI